MALPKRKIEEEIARLTLDRNLRIVYVEGPFDRAIVSSFFDQRSTADIEVCDISLVSVHVYAGGNRARVIKLSQQLSEELPESNDHVRCIADRDLESVTGVEEENRYLLYTEFTSMDLYFFRRATLRRVVNVNFRSRYHASYYDSLVECARVVFALRICLVDLDLQVPVRSIEDDVLLIDECLHFDEARYLNRVALPRGYAGHIDAIVEEAATVRGKLSQDERLSMHSKDIHYLIRKLGKELNARSESRSITAIQDALVAATDEASLGSFRLFQQLMEWTTVRSAS